MIAIDDALRWAAQRAASWTPELALEVSRRLAPVSSSLVDWDEGAGEGWIRVINDQRLVAFVSIRLPLVMAEGAQGCSARRTVDDLMKISVSDFDSACLSCSAQVLVATFGDSRRLDLICRSGFSVNDLWYATV